MLSISIVVVDMGAAAAVGTGIVEDKGNLVVDLG